MGWIEDRWHDLAGLGSGSWLALAVWVAVLVGLIALLYAQRHMARNRELTFEQLRPNVSMYMEPHSADWHVIELVVKNFGQTAAYNVRFQFTNPPTVAQYENERDGIVDIGELALPAELPMLAPSQEWRTVWDSTLDRNELGSAIEWKFDGMVKYFDRPQPQGRFLGLKTRRRRLLESTVTLDWESLQPVQRIELLTSHDLAKREKHKLELLRSLLNYFHVASKETRPEVYRQEIDRVDRATEEVRARLADRRLEGPADVRQAARDTDNRQPVAATVNNAPPNNGPLAGADYMPAAGTRETSGVPDIDDTQNIPSAANFGWPPVPNMREALKVGPPNIMPPNNRPPSDAEFEAGRHRGDPH